MHARVMQSWKKVLVVAGAAGSLAGLPLAAWAIDPGTAPAPGTAAAPAAGTAPAPAPAPAPAAGTAPDPDTAPKADAAGKDGTPCDDCDRHGKAGEPCGDCDECDECDECDDCDDQDGDEPCADCDEHGKGEHHPDAERHPGMRHGPGMEHGPGSENDPGKEHGPGDSGRGFGPQRRGPMGMPPFGFGVKPELLLQFQPAILTGDQNQLTRGDRAERPGFAMRTARVGLSGVLGRRARFVLDTDLANLAVSPLTQAFVGLTAWRNAELLVGAHKVPFSRFAMLGSGEQALIERPLSVQAMAPFYQLGATLTGHYPHLLGLRWYLGGYNSFERQTNFYGGIRENSGLAGNRFGGVSYAARVQLEPFGDLRRPVADLDHSRFKLEVGGGFLYDDSGTTRATAFSADLQVKFRGVHAIVEMVQDHAQPRTLPTTPQTIPAEITRRALIGELGYAYRRVNAAVRMELVDPNTDVKDNRDETILSAGAGYQVMRNRMRVQLQFDHRTEKLTPVKNDTLFAQVQLML